MAVRSVCLIGYKMGDKAKMAISIFDGYPSYTGKILLENYNELAKVKELINEKNIIFLRENIKSTEFFNIGYFTFVADFYNDIREIQKQSVADNAVEYVYVFKDTKWFFGDIDSDVFLKELTQETCV